MCDANDTESIAGVVALLSLIGKEYACWGLMTPAETVTEQSRADPGTTTEGLTV